MQIDKDKFVDILQARREMKILGTANNRRKVISNLKKKVLKYAQDNNIGYHLIPHDCDISKPAELYIPKEYVNIFLKSDNIKYKSSKISKYERLTINTTGKSFRDTLKELGITYQCFRHRLKDSWSFARAITTPHKDMLERPAGHKLYTPKHFYKGKTIRQYLKETDSPLTTSLVYKRLKLGWDMDRALHTPKGDKEFKRKRFQSLAHSKKKLVIVGTIKGKAVTSDKISTLHKLQQYAEN